MRGESKPAQQQFEDLFCLTHVCSRWRALGLRLAELWGDVALVKAKNSEMFNTLLSRAGNAPLCTPFPPSKRAIDGDSTFDEQDAYIQSHAERFRIVWHRGTARCNWNTMLSGKLFPDLHTAVFESRTRSLNVMQAPLRAPALDSISFKAFFIPFEAPKLTALRVTLTALPPLTFELGYLIEVLASVPNLVELGLDGCLPVVYEPGDTIEPVELSHLRFVILTGSGLSLWLLLRKLRPGNPDSVIMHLDARNLVDETDVNFLAKALKPYLGGSSRNTIRIRPDSTWFFDTCMLPSGYKRRDEHGLIFLAPNVVADIDNQELLSILYEALFRQFSPDQVENLVVTFSPDSPARNILSMSAVSALRVPQLADSVRTIVYHIPTTNYRAHGGVMDFDMVPRFLLQEQEDTRYGKLENLVFRANELVYASATTTRRPIIQLREWLEDRVRIGKPLRTLTLEGVAYAIGPAGEFFAEDNDTFNEIRELVDVVDDRTMIKRLLK